MEIRSAVALLASDAIHVQLDNMYWRLCRGRSLEELWEEIDPGRDPDDCIPYWTELWPSSLLLSAFLLANAREFSGKICIDLGCGLGFTALLGQLAGGRVIGMDNMREALQLARRHAPANLAPQPLWLCADWREYPLRSHKAWRIWAADIVYEKRFTKPLLGFMVHALAPRGRVWIAEPGRAIFQQFLETALESGWRARRRAVSPVASLYPQTAQSTVTIWEFSLSSS